MKRWIRRLWLGPEFALFFLWEMLLSNLWVAYDTIRPIRYLDPGIVAIPLDLHNDTQITLLSNLITLTPGTIGLDVSDDRKVLYIHAMHVRDAERVRRSIKHGFERRILEITR
ncbi:MAG: Na+/H+ antiporter subunit E [Bryobacterales bacterium]|nr:Na+/H+ antiporter subunit E [Bryobacterales bacterium]